MLVYPHELTAFLQAKHVLFGLVRLAVSSAGPLDLLVAVVVTALVATVRLLHAVLVLELDFDCHGSSPGKGLTEYKGVEETF